MPKPKPKANRLKNMVEAILKENPRYNSIEAVNSDISLWIIICQRWYNVGTNEDSVVHLRKLYDMPTQDAVKRWRAHFQNDLKLYPPTSWKVAKLRKWNREEWEEALGYKPSGEEIARTKQAEKELETGFNAAVEASQELSVMYADCGNTGCEYKVKVEYKAGQKPEIVFHSSECRDIARRKGILK